ncbi:MAG: transposase, partial [Bacillota bacterium]
VQRLGETVRYRTHRYACRGCELQPQCGAQRAGISRISDTIASALAVLGTPRGRRAMALRKCWVETVNADLKNNRSLSRAHYRGNRAVTIQALLAACAHNIYQLVVARFSKRESSVVALRSIGQQERLALVA